MGAALSTDAVISALADLLAPKVAELLAARAALAAVPAYYSQGDSPLGKRRFLEAARAGCFPSSKRGKLVLAQRADVEAWIAAGARLPVVEAPAENDTKPAPAAEADPSDEALLAAAGIRLAPAPKGKR